VKLSSTRIRFLKPQNKPSRLTDGGGLSLEVRPSGACLWRYRYRIAGKENVFAIGSFPDISLKTAREARDEARKLVEKGIHPAHQRKVRRSLSPPQSADTFEAVAREWLGANRGRWTSRTFEQRRRLLERDVLPSVGELPMSRVTAAHCLAALKRIEARGALQTAALARQCVGAISRFAVATRRSENDLAFSLRNLSTKAPMGRRRHLSPRQIPKFFAALDRYPGSLPTKAAIRLLWLTLARPKEVMRARWEEFDLHRAVWTIPAVRMHPPGLHAVPLPRQAVDLLGELRAATRGSAHLIPNRIDPQRHAAQSVLIKALANMGYAGSLTPFGIRLTGRAILADAGYPRGILDRQLGYAVARSSTAVEEEDARRLMMQWWADEIDSLCAGGPIQLNLQIM